MDEAFSGAYSKYRIDGGPWIQIHFSIELEDP